MLRLPALSMLSAFGMRCWIGLVNARIWIRSVSALSAVAPEVTGPQKLPIPHRGRIRAAVNHGGPAHYAFAEEWIIKAQRGEYPFELAETLACAFGRSSAEEWVEYSPRLSLLDQGILNHPCAPLLCVNGVNDSVFPIADMYLLLEHGDPKTARFFPGGHMGGSGAQGVILSWLKENLGDGGGA